MVYTYTTVYITLKHMGIPYASGMSRHPRTLAGPCRLTAEGCAHGRTDG